MLHDEAAYRVPICDNYYIGKSRGCLVEYINYTDHFTTGSKERFLWLPKFDSLLASGKDVKNQRTYSLIIFNKEQGYIYTLL